MDIDSCYLAQLPGSSEPKESCLHACDVSNQGSAVSLRYDVTLGKGVSVPMRGQSCHLSSAQSSLINPLQ